jgi:hypothetical protein
LPPSNVLVRTGVDGAVMLAPTVNYSALRDALAAVLPAHALATEPLRRFAEAPRLTPLDVEALDAFDVLANDAALNMTMRMVPGDLQFVHNHVLLHDRTGFEDRDAPERKRHLLRRWLVAPGARELPPAFAVHYGSITVGDHGGIVVPGMQFTVPLAPS